MNWFESYVEATRIAIIAHGDQKRKFTGDPYITHPIRVSGKVFQVTGSYQMAIAGVLHDVIEDTKVTGDSLGATFGKTVQTLVESVTKDKSLPKDARETEYLQRVSKASRETIILKLADRFDNVQEMLHPNTPNDFRIKYARNTDKLLNTIASNVSIMGAIRAATDRDAISALVHSIISVFDTAVDAGVWPKEARLKLDWLK